MSTEGYQFAPGTTAATAAPRHRPARRPRRSRTAVPAGETGRPHVPVIRAVEPAACPSLTRGVYAYDFGDTVGLTPLLKMHTLGHNFIPDPIHAGGLRYHGMSPLLPHIYELGLIEAIALPQNECFAAGVRFARSESIIPAPEPTHALAATMREALRCRESGEEKVILTALCGHAHLDLPAYGQYLAGEIVDHELPQDEVDRALTELPVPAGRLTFRHVPLPVGPPVSRPVQRLQTGHRIHFHPSWSSSSPTALLLSQIDHLDLEPTRAFEPTA